MHLQRPFGPLKQFGRGLALSAALFSLEGCSSPEPPVTGTAAGRAQAASVTADGVSKPPRAKAVASAKPHRPGDAPPPAAPPKPAAPTPTPVPQAVNPAIAEAKRSGPWSVSPDGKSLPPRSMAAAH